MLSSDAGGKAVRPSEGDITWLDPTRHIVCFGCGVDNLVDCLHGEIECHKFALTSLFQLKRRMSSRCGKWEHTTGCKPANAAPTVRPAKPDSVIGLSMTLFSPNRSSSPLVTLYLFQISDVRQKSFLPGFGRTPTLHCTGQLLHPVRILFHSTRALPRELRSEHLSRPPLSLHSV